jgi:hypothetical protein
MSDGVLDGSAPALPEHRLAQFLADPGRLVRSFAEQMGTQHRDPRLDQGLARHGTADALQAFIADHLDEGVEILLGLIALRPTAVHGSAGQPDDADIDDLHQFVPRWGLLVRRTSGMRLIFFAYCREKRDESQRDYTRLFISFAFPSVLIGGHSLLFSLWLCG